MDAEINSELFECYLEFKQHYRDAFKNFAARNPGINKVESLTGMSRTNRTYLPSPASKLRSNSRSINRSEIDKKLLQDSQIYQRKIDLLTTQNDNLVMRERQLEEEKSLIQKKYEVLREKYERHKPLISHFEFEQMDNASAISNLPLVSKESDSKHQQNSSNSEALLREKIQVLEQMNSYLKKENIKLKKMTENQCSLSEHPHEKKVLFSLDPLKQTKSVEIQAAEREQRCNQNPERSKDDVLQKEVQRLKVYIKDMEKKHKKLKDRCANIRHLFDGQSPAS